MMSSYDKRSFEFEQARFNRPLSAMEQAGWRRSWDGWTICPICVAEKEARVGRLWAVPANYDRPIRDEAKCGHCAYRITSCGGAGYVGEAVPEPFYWGLLPWLYRRLTGWRDEYGRKAQFIGWGG